MAASEFKTYFQTFKTDHLGQIFMTGTLNVEAYSKISIEIIQWPHVAVSMNVLCDMGKITGPTLAQTVAQFALGTAGLIHSFDVIGPEFSVVLTGGPANTDVPIQAWVFMH
jgi:hypothetical protein